MLSPRLRLTLARARWAITTHPGLVLGWSLPAAMLGAGHLLNNPHLGRWGLYVALFALLASAVRIGAHVMAHTRHVADTTVGRLTEIVAYWEEDVVRREGRRGELRIVTRPRPEGKRQAT